MYLAEDPAEAALLLDKVIAGCRNDDVPEIVSLGKRWPGGGPRSSPTTTPVQATVPPRG